MSLSCIILVVSMLQLGATVYSQQEELTVSGLVSDASGAPISGVSVRVKGTTTGVVSDGNGKYTVTVSGSDAVLVFSCIGYVAQEITAGSQTVINVVLDEDIESIDEVVVVGYGTQRKGNLTGSIAEVKTEKLTVAPINSVSNMLGGQLAGLTTKQRQGEPGADAATLSIRGFDGPLVIVDGVEAGMNNIDPAQIESVTILKDGAASIYGARAGNGVVLVTTKRGNISKPVITLNSSTTWSGYTHILEASSSGQRAEYEREAHLNSGLPEASAPYTEEQVRKYYDGTDPDYPNSDWFDATIRPWAPQQNHNLSIRGGSEKIKYFGYVSYNNAERMIRHDGGNYSRYNISSNIDAKITDRISASADIYMSQERNLTNAYGSNVYAFLYYAEPKYPTSLPDPRYLAYADFNQLNPIFAFSTKLGGYSESKAPTFRGSGTLSYDFKYVQGLKAKASINYGYASGFSKTFTKTEKFYIYEHDSDTYIYMSSSYPTTLSYSSSYSEVVTQQYSLSYNNTFRDAHNLSVLLLYESINSDYVSNGLSRSGFKSTALDQLIAGDATTSATSAGESEMGRTSWVGRLNYNYRDRYLLETIFRADASAKFHPNYRWGFFPNISLGWVVSQENFMRSIRSLDNMKLRLSMGQSGYDNVGDFRYLSVYGFNGQYILGGQTYQGMYSTGIANPVYSWERMSIYNAGLDFSFLNRKIYGTAEVFYRLRDDILGTRANSLPSTFGASLPVENLNSISTKGFELSLGTASKIGDFSYDVSGNISWNRSKWVKYDEPEYTDEDERFQKQRTGNYTDRRIGYVSDGLFASQAEIDALPYVYADLNNSNDALRPGDIKYKDLNNDGILNWRDQAVIGYGAMPHWMYGINTVFKYKNFDLSMLFQGAFAFTTYANLVHYSGEPIWDRVAYAMEHRWTEENNDTHAFLPRIGSKGLNGLYSDYHNYNTSYIRLKNASFGYELPVLWMKKAGISRARIYVAGTNLLTFSNLEIDIDPEINEGSVQYVYPLQRTISIGLNLSF